MPVDVEERGRPPAPRTLDVRGHHELMHEVTTMPSTGATAQRINLRAHVPATFTGTPKPGGDAPRMDVMATFDAASGDAPAVARLSLPAGFNVTSVFPDGTPFRQQDRSLEYSVPARHAVIVHGSIAAGAHPGFTVDGRSMHIGGNLAPTLLELDGRPAPASHARSASTDLLLPRGWEQSGGDQSRDGARLARWNGNATSLDFLHPLGTNPTVDARFTGAFQGTPTTGAGPTMRYHVRDVLDKAARIAMLPLALPFAIALARAERG